MHNLSEPLLYRALSAKIGVLNSNLVIGITEFHQNFQQAKAWLPLLVEDRERGFSYAPGVVLRPCLAAVEGSIPTLESIESMIKLSRRKHPLDLGLTEAMIEMEDMGGEVSS